jgi:hypothetical protein
MKYGTWCTGLGEVLVHPGVFFVALQVLALDEALHAPLDELRGRVGIGARMHGDRVEASKHKTNNEQNDIKKQNKNKDK